MGSPPNNDADPDDGAPAETGRGEGADRELMVVTQIEGRGVRDPRVLDAMRRVPREEFVPRWESGQAFADRPLPIGEGQTISQPFIVAYMAEAAEVGSGDRVLEVGTGSGYGAAVLGVLAAEVWTVERLASLASEATARLAAEGMGNVHVCVGDGTLGWPEAAPFDAIVVTAAGPDVPDALLDQLADGGRLVIPVGRHVGAQTLLRVRRSGDRFEEEDLGGVAFVPLIGEEGFPP